MRVDLTRLDMVNTENAFILDRYSTSTILLPTLCRTLPQYFTPVFSTDDM